ncbi:MAG: serine/threonine protein kinase [Deltaproteobacteria bacterium]|nr:serine/threonine protein kinase [Deltaproteobacteria bacterium]
MPVLFGGSEESGEGADDGATVVTVGVPRGGTDAGDVIGERYQTAGDPRPDLWGVFVRARDIQESRDVTLYRVERSVFRTRDDIEGFRAGQQDLMDADEPSLALPERIFESGGQWYLVYGQRFAGTLRDSAAATAFRGAGPDHVKRVLHFVADYLSTLARLGTRGLHLALRPGIVFVSGRELRVAQTGFCSALPAELVARRLAHDAEAKFFTAPEILRDGRGSARADLYSLGLLVGYAISGRERSPQLKGFQPHPRFARIFSSMVAPNEIQRPADIATLAAATSALATLDEVIAAPRTGPARVEGTQDVAVDDIEPLEDAVPGRDATGEIDVGEIEPVRDGDGTGEIDVGEIEPVTGETPGLLAGRTGELTGGGFESFDDTDPGAAKAELPVVGDDSWQAPSARARPVPSTPRSAAAPKVQGRAAAHPEESDGAIDPRLLRAAVRSDSSKGIAAKGKAVDLLRRDAAKGDARAKELLLDASTRLPVRPAAAPAPAAPGPRPSRPGFDPFAPHAPAAPAPVPVVRLAGAPAGSRTLLGMSSPSIPPAPLAPAPFARSAPPPAAAAPRPSAAAYDPFAPSASRPSGLAPAPLPRPSTPPPAPSRPAPPPAPPARMEIPSSVVGPDLVVKKAPAAPRAPAASEPDVATTEATPMMMGGVPPVAAMPVVVRRVPRPMEEERDLPPTEAWSPRRELEVPPPVPGPGPMTAPPLFDDSYKLFKADELEKLPPPLPPAAQPAPPDRSMDLIWWSLAIAGLLVLVALLITFR